MKQRESVLGWGGELAMGLFFVVVRVTGFSVPDDDGLEDDKEF